MAETKKTSGKGTKTRRSRAKPAPEAGIGSIALFDTWFCVEAQALADARFLAVPCLSRTQLEERSLLLAFRFVNARGRRVVDPKVDCTYSAPVGYHFRYLRPDRADRLICTPPGIEDSRIKTVLCRVTIWKKAKVENVDWLGRPCLEKGVEIAGASFTAFGPLAAWKAAATKAPARKSTPE